MSDVEEVDDLPKSRLEANLPAVWAAENPEPRVPVVLMLDCSGSMEGDPITALNDGVVHFAAEVIKDSTASLRVDLAVVTFGKSVDVAQDFTGILDFEPVDLEAAGKTRMGQALDKALDMLEARKQEYRDNGLQYYRPWVFMITDGAPSFPDEFEAAKARLAEARDDKKLLFWAIGVEGADMDTCKELAGDSMALALKGLEFKEMFQWLSASVTAVSHSTPGDQLALPAAQGWVIET